MSLPALPPPPQPREHPLKSLLAAFRFLLASPLVGGIALLGGLMTMASAVRVLYPALAISWQMSAAQIGMLYAAIPLGAAVGALTSGKLAHSLRPGLIMLASTIGSFLAIGLFALMPVWALDAGKYVRAHQRVVDGAKRHRGRHWCGVIRRSGSDHDTGGFGER